MNPDTNKFEPLSTPQQLGEAFAERADALLRKLPTLLRPNGDPVPDHWVKFQLDELVEIKGYTFRVKYIGETAILFEPVKKEL